MRNKQPLQYFLDFLAHTPCLNNNAPPRPDLGGYSTITHSQELLLKVYYILTADITVNVR